MKNVKFTNQELRTVQELCETMLELMMDNNDEEELLGELWVKFVNINRVIDRLEQQGCKILKSRCMDAARKFYRDNEGPNPVGRRRVYAENLYWDFSEFMTVYMTDGEDGERCYVPMDRILAVYCKGEGDVRIPTEDFILVIKQNVVKDIVRAWRENWEDIAPVDVAYEIRKHQPGSYWELTADELYQDFNLYRGEDPSVTVDEYVDEFEHQEGWLNPRSVEGLKKLVAKEEA